MSADEVEIVGDDPRPDRPPKPSTTKRLCAFFSAPSSAAAASEPSSSTAVPIHAILMTLLSKTHPMRRTERRVAVGLPSHIPQTRGTRQSDHGAVRDHAVLRHDDDAVPDVITRPVGIFLSRLVHDAHVPADPRVLVDDR